MVKKKVIYENVVLPAEISQTPQFDFGLRLDDFDFSSLKLFSALKNFIFNKTFYGCAGLAVVCFWGAVSFNWLFLAGSVFFGSAAFFVSFLNHRVAAFLLGGTDGIL